MKKIGIVTMLGNENCGNRLQNYALQEILKKMNFDVYTIKNDRFLNSNEKFFYNSLRYIKKEIKELGKAKKFKNFNKRIVFSKEFLTIKNYKKIDKKYDYFVVGSDQIWKPTRLRMSFIDLLGFASPEKRISYAPSFGIESIDNKYYKLLKEELPKFKAISVREFAGKKIIYDATGIEDVTVVLDPTFMLENEEWEKIENKPKEINEEKTIFTYFLGDEEIDKIKKMYNNSYKVINFYDYEFGPQEFLYLINHSELILTDSYHACIFSILFHKKFYIFDRKQSKKDNNMNSRIDTLIQVFKIEDRKIDNIDNVDITKEIDYLDVDKILSNERKKSQDFLDRALKE